VSQPQAAVGAAVPRVDDDVDSGDPAFGDGEGDEGERGSVGAPGHVAGDAIDQHGPLAGDLAGEHAGPGGDLGGAEGDDHAIGRVDGQLHVRVEDTQKCCEVAAAGGGAECLDDLSVLAAGARRSVRGLDLAAGAAGDHLGGGGGLAQDPADFVERDCEHVVQDERQALARGE
jgi:hypothetical protein